MTHLVRLFDHVLQADADVRAALDTLPADAPQAARAHRIYAHLAAAEEVWLARLEGRAPDTAVWPEPDPDADAARADRSARRLREIAAEVGPEDHDRTVTYRNSAGREFTNRIEDVLLHVALHGAYHRGQLALLVRDGGGEPVSTDFIAFLRGVPAP